MKRWIKSLKPYTVMLLAIIGLLIVQVMCDLTLPDYTSKIIDTGIQNSGVEHVVPEKITADEFKSAEIFMNDDEKQAWEDAYNKDGDIYDIKYTDEETLNALDDKLAMSLILDSQFSSLDEESLNRVLENQKGVTAKTLGVTQYPVDLRPTMSKMISSGMMTTDSLEKMKTEMKTKLDEAGGATLQKSMGIAYAKSMDKKAGVDLNAKQQSYLWSAGRKMIIIAGIMAVAMILVVLLASKIGAAVGRDLRNQTYGKVIKFSNMEIEKFSTASLITRTTNDIQQIQQSTTLLLRMALYSPIMAVAGVIKVATTGAGIGWVIALAVLAIFGVIILLFSLVMPKFKVIQKLIDNINRISREILTGLPVIRAFGTEKKEEKRFEKANDDLYRVQLFVNKTMSFMMPAFMFIMFGLSALIIWVSAGRIDAGLMQVGQMTAFITYAMLIVMSFLMLTMLAILVPRSVVAANRLDEVITTEPSITSPENAIELKDPKGIIEFKNVDFKYSGAEEDVIKDVSFKAMPGETTAIIGSTGCGKSTLIQLIPRLYDVTGGEISLDGVDIRKLDMHELRDEIAYIPQKGVLFSGTIGSNIRYGNENATVDEVAKAADTAQASEFINNKELGYDSPISQGGTNVSGGQKQRLSIARALAKNSRVLIFDDSFSALDLKTDRKLRDALKKNVYGATMIIVAQRVSTIMDADQILVMEDGKVVGKGTHQQLLAECETYREIAESQMTKEELYGKEA